MLWKGRSVGARGWALPEFSHPLLSGPQPLWDVLGGVSESGRSPCLITGAPVRLAGGSVWADVTPAFRKVCAAPSPGGAVCRSRCSDVYLSRPQGIALLIGWKLLWLRGGAPGLLPWGSHSLIVFGATVFSLCSLELSPWISVWIFFH